MEKETPAQHNQGNEGNTGSGIDWGMPWFDTTHSHCFFRCLTCGSLLTHIVIREETGCPCGARQYAPTNPLPRELANDPVLEPYRANPELWADILGTYQTA